MKNKFTLFFYFIFFALVAKAQIIINNAGVPYTQDFNTLTATGTTANTLPMGWSFLESGANADATYAISNGTVNSGNTYSFGATGNTDRAFGGLRSGSLVPIIGAAFTNNSSAIITSLQISFTGEQWRVGTLGRADRLDFQYSTDATTLNNGTYIDVNELDFAAPTTTGAIGALDGNAAANRTSVTFTITGLNIPVGNTFWIRWNDPDATSADDGLGIDDFSLVANGTPVSPCAEPSLQPTNLSLNANATSVTGSFTLIPGPTNVENYFIVRSTSSTLTQSPVDGVSYTNGQVVNGGNGIAVGISSDGTFTNTVVPSTQYYYFVFAMEDQGCTGGPNYNQITPLTGTVTSPAIAACTTPATPTALTLTPANSSITGTFTGSGANKYLAVISTSATLNASPANGTVYTAGQSFGGGTVVSYGAATGFAATGLTVATTYYLFVFGVNDACTGEPIYSSVSLNGTSVTTNVSTGIPAGYYNAAAGLTCAALKTALSTITTTGHTQNNYGSLDDVAMLTTDDRLNDAGTATIVYDMYSDNPAGPEPYTFIFGQGVPGSFNFGTGTDGEGNGWNKEHSFPNSWFSSTSSTSNFPGADLHHIFPTDMDVNSLRGNYPFGVVATASTTTMNGGKLGTSTISFPGYSGPVFEPIDAYKGDFARATLYMVTRYQAEQPSWENLQPTGDVVMDGTTWPSVEPAYLQMLINWHNADPVSTKEIERNNEVFGYQSNRNPFVDHPEYVGLVWGPSCGAVVPVTITRFEGKYVVGKTELTWTTENPRGFSHFVVERSTDGFTFSAIGNVPSASNQTYNFSDNNLPVAGNVFYRLRMVDLDASFKLSQIINVRLSADLTAVAIYPNPAAYNLQVKFADPLPANSSLRITDAAGRVMLQQNLNAGVTISNTNLSGLGAGKYFILITNSKQQTRESFIIIR